MHCIVCMYIVHNVHSHKHQTACTHLIDLELSRVSEKGTSNRTLVGFYLTRRRMLYWSEEAKFGWYFSCNLFRYQNIEKVLWWSFHGFQNAVMRVRVQDAEFEFFQVRGKDSRYMCDVCLIIFCWNDTILFIDWRWQWHGGWGKFGVSASAIKSWPNEVFK